MEPNIYKIVEPSANKIPIILSIPHAGTLFPDEIKHSLNPEMADVPDDTDWFVDRLYDFAPSLGITMVVAQYHRWVIDLNRNPENLPLYSDGRVITGLVPTTDFNGNSIYSDGFVLDEKEIQRRKDIYFYPYYQEINRLLEQTKKEFGKVLLFDVHSIRKKVPGIQKEEFPDLILGDNDEKSAAPELIETTVKSLSGKGYGFSHNHPFKGGNITRYFGKPEENIHALQLEMSKLNYMDDTELNYHEDRSEKIRNILKNMLVHLSETLNLLR